MADWFAENAPQAKSDTDWFAANAPAKEPVPEPHALDSIGHGLHEFLKQVNPVPQVQGLADAIRHPLDAASHMGQQNLDLWNKAKDAYTNGDYAGAVRHGINYALNGIPGLGSTVDQAGDKFANGDIAGGVGSSLGIGASLAAGTKAPELVSDAMALPARAIGKTGIPERQYGSALKPSTKLSPADRAKVINTGLNEEIPVSQAGSEALGGKLNSVNQSIRDVISDKAAQGDTIDPKAVATRVDQVRPKFANQVNPTSDLSAIDASKQEFLDGPGAGPIPVDMAQDLKQGTYRQVKKSYGQLSGAQVEAQKALARGIKEELATKYPELSSLNERDSGLIALNNAIDKATARINNHQIFGIGTPLAAGAGAAVTGSPVAGLVIGAARAMLDNPIIKSHVAIALRRASKAPLATGAGLSTGQAVRGAAMAARPDPLDIGQHLDNQ